MLLSRSISLSVNYRIFQFSVSSIISLCRLEVNLTFSLNFIVNLSSSYLIIAFSSNLRLLRVLLLAITEIYYVELGYEIATALNC